MFGAIDTNVDKCLHAIDYKMDREIKSSTDSAHSSCTPPMALFAQQMCPPPFRSIGALPMHHLYSPS